MKCSLLARTTVLGNADVTGTGGVQYMPLQGEHPTSHIHRIRDSTAAVKSVFRYPKQTAQMDGVLAFFTTLELTYQSGVVVFGQGLATSWKATPKATAESLLKIMKADEFFSTATQYTDDGKANADDDKTNRFISIHQSSRTSSSSLRYTDLTEDGESASPGVELLRRAAIDSWYGSRRWRGGD